MAPPNSNAVQPTFLSRVPGEAQAGPLDGASNWHRAQQAALLAPPIAVPPLPVPAWSAPEAAAAAAPPAAGIKREREEPHEERVKDLYDLDIATKEIMSPSFALVNELAQEMGQVNLDEDNASEPSPRPQSAGSLYRRSLNPGASGSRTPAEGDPLSTALAQPPMPLQPRLAAEDEAELAMAVVETAAAALRRAIDALNRGRVSASFTAEPQLALFCALSDLRLLDTPACYRSMRGRARLKRHLAVLRSVGESGARMARRVVEATAEALLAPLPGPEPDPAPGWPVSTTWRPRNSAEWTMEDAELLVDRMWGFTWATTTEITGGTADLHPLPWSYAERFLLRLGELSLPFLKDPGTLHAKVLCLTGHILNQFDRPKDAIAAYFEAWAELRRRALTPSRLEATLIFNLAHLLFRDFQVQTAAAVMEKGYIIAGDRDDELFSAARLEYLQATYQVWRRDHALSFACTERSLRFISELGPELSVLTARDFLMLGMASVFRGNVLGLRHFFMKAIEELVALRDPGAPELDIVSLFLYGVGRVSTERNFIMGLSLVLGFIPKVDKKTETPMLAHAHFHLACMLMRIGKLRQAADTFRKAAKGYASPKFAHYFPPDCHRVRRIAELLNQISSGQAAAAAAKATAGGEDRKVNFLQRYFSAAFGGGKRSRVGPADVPSLPTAR